jgi:hypothetical protein
VHVLHLVDSRSVLRQLLQLVRPGAYIVLARDWIDPGSFAGQLRNEFRQAVVDLAERWIFPSVPADTCSSSRNSGLFPSMRGRSRPRWSGKRRLSPMQVLDGIRSRDDAESWVLPDPLLGRVMERLDATAPGDGTTWRRRRPVTRRFVYSLFRVP